jgi:NitT/TauT family transport system substrate-binding protein
MAELEKQSEGTTMRPRDKIAREDQSMATFIIHTHGRLQEWVAEEKGYFAEEGLTDYALSSHGLLSPARVRAPTLPVIPDNRQGAYQSYEQGRDASVSCACHWTVNKAASGELGRLWGECYTITPCAIFVPAGSAIRAPEDLANVGVHVGYQSGSHFTTLQALEPFLPAEQIKLTFGGSPADRVDQMLDGSAAAATVFGAQYYLLEQLGFRKIVDATFMIAAMVPRQVEIGAVRGYFAALRRAQADIDIMHQPYTRYYANEFPERHRALVDVRRFGPGERFVFEPYSKDMYDRTQHWIDERRIFPADAPGRRAYAEAVIRLDAVE